VSPFQFALNPSRTQPAVAQLTYPFAVVEPESLLQARTLASCCPRPSPRRPCPRTAAATFGVSAAICRTSDRQCCSSLDLKEQFHPTEPLPCFCIHSGQGSWKRCLFTTHINFDVKCTGARSAGNPHATCDVAGAGIRFTVRIVRPYGQIIRTL
jgi:hypothetical protein